jgi:hypothetical protein
MLAGKAGVDTGKDVADYIRTEYRGRNYIVVHEDMPRGFYQASLRFENDCHITAKPYEKAVFVSNIFMKELFRKCFNTGVKKVIYPGDGMMPLVIYEVKVDGTNQDMISRLKNGFNRAQMLVWDYGHAEAAEFFRNSEIQRPVTAIDYFYNTLCRMSYVETLYEMAYLKICNFSVLNDPLYNCLERIYPTADFYYNRGKIMLIAGDKNKARESFELAAKIARWWEAPQKKLLEIGGSGF